MVTPVAIADRVHPASWHDIPSLDGLRAVSIAIVVLSHSRALLPAAVTNSGPFRYVIGGGLHGVQVFFVISGYLITALLLREFEGTGDISLRSFYARRTLRIFPAFYAYLSVVAVLWFAGISPQDRSTFWAAATYTIIYHPDPRGWLLQHTWSLSIEEQFYLIWPTMLLYALRRGKAVLFSVGIIALMPIVRTILFLAEPSQLSGHNRFIVNSSAIDTLALGSLLALIGNDPRWKNWHAKVIGAWSAAGMIALGLVAVPYATAKLARTSISVLLGALGYTITAISIGWILVYVVTNPQSPAGRLLNLGAVRHLGVISYSIYLWQQLFTSNMVRFGFLTYVLILACAELSFWLIEKPLMRMRARFGPLHNSSGCPIALTQAQS